MGLDWPAVKGVGWEVDPVSPSPETAGPYQASTCRGDRGPPRNGGSLPLLRCRGSFDGRLAATAHKRASPSACGESKTPQ
jgi:hypothetical protein